MSSAISNAKVVVVGGPGAMGRHAVRIAKNNERIGQLVIADINLERASLLAQEVGAKAQPLKLDVRDRDQLDLAFAGASVVVNAMGPFSTFGRPILEAAISCGVDYIDINDDWDATVDALTLDDAASRAGVTALIGLGMSPGVTNMLAAHAASLVDTVDRIFTGWKLSGTGTDREPGLDAEGGFGGSAALAHWIMQCTGEVQTWQNGRAAMVAPLRRIVIDYPGIGEQETFSLGHPEPVTLPVTYSSMQESHNVMSGPLWMFEGLAAITSELADGTIELDRAMSRVGEIERPADPALSPRDPLPRAWALVEGMRDGELVSVASHLNAWAPHQMGGATGYPLAVGLELMLEGAVTRTGVVSPEAALDPVQFFDRLALLHEPARADAASLVEVVVRPGSATSPGGA